MTKTKNYHKLVNLIRPYTTGFTPPDYDLRKPLTRGQKSSITRMSNLIQSMTAAPAVRIYRPRSSYKLKKAQLSTNQSSYPKKLKVAFIRVADSSPSQVTVNKRGVLVRQHNVTRKFISLSRQLLLIDPEAAIYKALFNEPKRNLFSIQNGESEITSIMGNKENLLEEVESLMERYSSSIYDSSDKSSSYFGNWLDGVTSYSYNRIVDLNRYINRRSESKLFKKGLKKSLKGARRVGSNHRLGRVR